MLLKTLSDPADAVVLRDLQLLSEISKNSEDDYFSSFMVNLLQLFCTDRRLLESRGNFIIRHLCVNLSAERIYRALADCLEKDEVRGVFFFRRFPLPSTLNLPSFPIPPSRAYMRFSRPLHPGIHHYRPFGCVHLSNNLYILFSLFLQDVEFASIMVQNLNNNLITAPELVDLRKRLRNLETKV